MGKFFLENDTTYDQYVYAARHGFNFPIEQLVPFRHFPIHCFRDTVFDDNSLGQFHERCVSAVDVQGSGRWFNALERKVTMPSEFVTLVSRFKARFWCAHCNKPLFKMPRRVP